MRLASADGRCGVDFADCLRQSGESDAGADGRSAAGTFHPFGRGRKPARLIQQILTECLLLAIVSAGLGLIVAVWATSLASKVQPAALPSQTYTILDVRVLAFMASLAVLSAVLFGLLPALSVGRTHLFAARGSSESRNSRIVRDALVAAQVALTIVLLTASVSVVRAVSHELRIDRGFKPDGVVTASVALDGTVRDKPGLRLQYFEDALDRLRHLPGVRSASSTEFLPLQCENFIGGPYTFDGHPTPRANASIIPITDGYFATTGDMFSTGANSPMRKSALMRKSCSSTKHSPGFGRGRPKSSDTWSPIPTEPCEGSLASSGVSISWAST